MSPVLFYFILNNPRAHQRHTHHQHRGRHMILNSAMLMMCHLKLSWSRIGPKFVGVVIQQAYNAGLGGGHYLTSHTKHASAFRVPLLGFKLRHTIRNST